jgi:hypothetical protein
VHVVDVTRGVRELKAPEHRPCGRARSVQSSTPMSACRIERDLGNVAATLARGRREAEKFRSRWDGDEKGGDYTLRTPFGWIEGTYTVTGTVGVFVIEKKPSLLPCALIERVFDQFLRSG